MNALFKKCGYDLAGEMSFLGKEKTFYCYEKVLNKDKIYFNKESCVCKVTHDSVLFYNLKCVNNIKLKLLQHYKKSFKSYNSPFKMSIYTSS